jgi:hypothetical protein
VLSPDDKPFLAEPIPAFGELGLKVRQVNAIIVEIPAQN